MDLIQGIMITINALLVIVNVLYTPEHYWFVYPLFGWGLALAFHAFQVFRHRRKGAPA